MLTPVYTRQFPRDLERMLKRGKDAERFKKVAKLLLSESPLLPKHKDHKLSGSYTGRRDCHIENDRVLIYKKEATAIIFERTGTHSDLFE
jgi:mRNA interferase YafQ